MCALAMSLINGSFGLLAITGWYQGGRLKATDARDILKPVKVTLSTKDKVTKRLLK
jgi:hypothetical protein